VKYENILSEKDKLQKLMLNNEDAASENKDERQQLLQLKYKNYQLEQNIKDLRQKLHINDYDNSNIHHNDRQKQENQIDKSFQEQIPVSDDHYKIPINIIRNKSNLDMVKTSNSSQIQRKNMINSVENFQILPQPVIENQYVLQQPSLINGKSSTTTTTPTSVFDKKYNIIESKKTTTKLTRKLPKFVLPIPDLKNEEAAHELSRENIKDEDKKLSLDESLNKQQNEEINENENGAHEINDNDFNIEEKNSRNNFDTIDQDRNMINNAAEEFDAHKPLDKKSLGHDEDLIIRPPNGVNVKDKLKDEIRNDHGKEDYQEEDLHIEQQEDDLGDIGEYDDPNALKNGVAERN
jgi:hypothetical protein